MSKIHALALMSHAEQQLRLKCTSMPKKNCKMLTFHAFGTCTSKK